MKYRFLLLPVLFITSACSGETFSENVGSTRSFFSENLLFTRPVNIYHDRKALVANQRTLQAAHVKKQEISYDPYYPMPKPWNEKPEAVSLFP